MLFNSLHYFIFAPAVIAVYFALPPRPQKVWLLLVSFYFYAVFRIPFTALLLFSIAVTHIAVMGMRRYAVDESSQRNQRIRKAFLWIAIVGNASLLYFFKFIDFSFEVFNQILRLAPCDPMYAHATGVVLPMGISFFTLQAIGYAVDVYRGTIPAGRVYSFALFLSFFPQLVAGPIMRAKDLLHQFEQEHRLTYENVRAGMGLIAIGLFKKSMMADPAGVVVDQVYGDPGAYSSWTIWLAAMLHALQIYGDFSGYSDIAIGTGRIMGFRIPINFNRPFLAVDMTDLWRRWHISLSTWLRDYVYIPLGGGRVSTVRTYVNVFITMFVSGIWHGAGLNFVMWGVFHALMVVIERFVFSFESIGEWYRERLPRILKIVYSFSFFTFPLLFFRARALPEIGDAADVGIFMADRLLSFTGGAGVEVPASLLLIIFLLMGSEVLTEGRKDFFASILKKEGVYWSLVGIIVAYCLLLYSVTDSAPFVYFQF
ncbi:MAG: MBOAT family protein [bacterium]|nr:MBOAT family protein [bacterium]